MLLDENFRKFKNNFLYSDDFGSKNTFVNFRNYPSFEFGYEDIDLRVISQTKSSLAILIL